MLVPRDTRTAEEASPVNENTKGQRRIGRERSDTGDQQVKGGSKGSRNPCFQRESITIMLLIVHSASSAAALDAAAAAAASGAFAAAVAAAPSADVAIV